MSYRNVTLCLALLVTLLAPGVGAAAQQAIVHVPPARLTPGPAEFLFHARFVPSIPAFQALELCVRKSGESGYDVIPFLSEDAERFVARLPGRWATPPGLEYYIRSRTAQGKESVHFATASAPHLVVIDPTPGEQRRRARMARHKGRQTEFHARYDHVSFGATKQLYDEAEAGTALKYLNDDFNSFEASIRYSFLQDAIYHISFGYGMLGGVMGTHSPPLERWLADNASDQVRSKERPLQPGLYYGFGTAYWEFLDYFALEAKVIMGASYEGFEGGGGILARIGTLRGTHFDMGIEGVSHVGYRFVTEFQWSTLPHFRMSLRNEVTTYPTGEKLGVVPTYNATLELDWLELTGSIGYGVRKGFEQGGLSVGAGLALRL